MKLPDTTWAYTQTDASGRGYYDLQRGVWDQSENASRSVRQKSLYSIAARKTVSFSQWVKSSDPKIIDQVVKSAVEAYPLPIETEPGEVFSYRPIAKDGDSILVHTVVFPGEISGKPESEITQYFPSFSFLPPPEDSVVLWLEDRSWVVGFARNRRWAHVRSLGGAPNMASLSRTLQRSCMEMLLNDIVQRADSILVWAEESEGLRRELSRWATLVEFESKPAFVKPEHYAIVPNSVAIEQEARTQRKTNAAASVFVCFVLCLGVIALAVDLRLRSERNQLARIQLENLQPIAAEISGFSSEWSSLASIVEPARGPVEVLFLLSKLAGEGVRFNGFEMRDESEVNFGVEASSMKAATLFQSRLESSPDLAGYGWSFSVKNNINSMISFRCQGKWEGDQ